MTGSLSIVPTLVDANLVDEYRLLVAPIAIGERARLNRAVSDALLAVQSVPGRRNSSRS